MSGLEIGIENTKNFLKSMHEVDENSISVEIFDENVANICFNFTPEPVSLEIEINL